MNILLVDDSSTIRMTLALILDREGYANVAAKNAESALSMIDGGLEPDLVVTDLNMPGMDGIGLIREIRSRDRVASVPILLLTTETTPDIRLAARRAGATGWLVKPVDPVALVEVLQQVLARA